MTMIADVRAKFPQYDDMSDGELAAALHQKFYADMPAAEFADKIGLKPPEPVTTNNIVRSAATGVPLVGGLLNKMDAATNASLAPVLNGLFSEKDQLPEATWGERYAHSLRDQEGGDAKFAAQHPVVDTAAKITGGVAGSIPLMAAAPEFWGLQGTTLPRMMVRGAAANAELAGTDAAIRGDNPFPSAALGGFLGAAGPIAAAITRQVAAPVVSNIRALTNPEGYAVRQVARAIDESGLSTHEIADRIMAANSDGQGVYTLADSLGNPGQRMLSTVARAPGEGRTRVVEALENRQAGQGRRVAGALAEGFEAPQTAAQTRSRLTDARDTAADAEYGEIRNDARPVDVSNVVAHIDRTLSPGTAFHTGIANDSAESALASVRSKLTDGRSNLSDFEAVQRVRGDLADAHQAAIMARANNKARLLKGALRELDTSLENASDGFKAANARYSAASRDIGAVDAGRDAAMRGRPEDTIPDFQGLRPQGQAAYRAGYADPLISDAQSAAFGANKARPLTSDAFRDEASVMAPRNAQMQRRLSREQTMFETRNQALGGSRTADNLADADAAGIDPSVIGHIFSGNYAGAARHLIQAGSNLLNGNTAEVRARLADILLQHGADVTPASLDRMIGETLRQVQRMQHIAATTRGAVQGAADVAPETLSRKRQLVRRN